MLVFWHEVGRRMGIKDIPDSYAALEAWSQVFMVNIPLSCLLIVVGYCRHTKMST
jgi:hypothetical protein